MISAEELKTYITALQAAGITGKAKIGDIEVTIPPLAAEGSGTAQPKRSAKTQYDALLFACTEGIPEDDEASS